MIQILNLLQTFIDYFNFNEIDGRFLKLSSIKEISLIYFQILFHIYIKINNNSKINWSSSCTLSIHFNLNYYSTKFL